MTSRRDFVATTALAGGALALGRPRDAAAHSRLVPHVQDRMDAPTRDLLMLAASWLLYRPAIRGARAGKADKLRAMADKPAATSGGVQTGALPQPGYGFASGLAQLLSRTAFEMALIFRSPAYLVLIALALAFAGVVFWLYNGPTPTGSIDALIVNAPTDTERAWTAVELYLTGYVVEYTLAMDNVFVIGLIFTYFAVPRAYQHRVLFWGIIGALIMRGSFVALGVILIERFDWIYTDAIIRTNTKRNVVIFGTIVYLDVQPGGRVFVEDAVAHFRVKEASLWLRQWNTEYTSEARHSLLFPG
jgi:hypothetical protein